MLVCITCGSCYDANARPAVDCPLCGDELLELVGDPGADAAAPVHADVATRLRQQLLGVGA
jgi:hypothetical protein